MEGGFPAAQGTTIDFFTKNNWLSFKYREKNSDQIEMIFRIFIKNWNPVLKNVTKA